MSNLLLAIALLTPQNPAVGITALRIIDTQPAETLQAVVWYPTHDTPHDTTLGLHSARVANGAMLAPSPAGYPVILISHGTGGNEFGHLDLAMALAEAGFVVVTVRHPGDNYLDASGLGTDQQFYGRSHDMVRALDQVLGDPRWKGHLDANRIGFVGFSSGGYAGLTLLGAKPDLARLGSYCGRNVADSLYCAAGLRGTVHLQGRYTSPQPDSRIGAAALMAPAFGFLFDSLTLARVKVPVLLFRAGADQIVREPENATWVARFLPAALPVNIIAGAGHYVFLAPCSPAFAARLPTLCEDPPGVDRSTIHAALNSQLIAFFRRYLG